MPREFFNHEHDTPEHSGPRATVGWGRAPEVQVGVIHSPHEVVTTLTAWLHEKLRKDLDVTPAQVAAVVACLTEPSSPALGWHTSLGRSEVNRLIKTLRRARDTAFGADA